MPGASTRKHEDGGDDRAAPVRRKREVHKPDVLQDRQLSPPAF